MTVFFSETNVVIRTQVWRARNLNASSFGQYVEFKTFAALQIIQCL